MLAYHNPIAMDSPRIAPRTSDLFNKRGKTIVPSINKPPFPVSSEIFFHWFLVKTMFIFGAGFEGLADLVGLEPEVAEVDY